MNPSTASTASSRLDAMLLIRAYEQQLIAAASPTNPGTCTSVGQEACAVGVVSALGPQDKLLTHHRSAGHLLARGADPERLFAEVLGRATGYCRGHAGSLHISVKALGVVLTSTIVGGGLSLAPGVALAQKLGAQPEGITAVFFGDGAACQGIFHEAVNLAVTWRLPVLFVCENNQWQAYVHRRETMPGEHVADWVQGHGLVAEVIDGNDVEAVHLAAVEAVAAIRDSGSPRLLELTTYRQRGHFEPDDQAYVCATEHAQWLARDPIQRQAERLMLSADDLGRREARMRGRIAQAYAAALSAPWPQVA
ncbi:MULTISPECIES: thiamine pyrophosphate-dependent dehydrogenase E1 component subunit alpha [unclassified Roseateles]|uniref:thiamine pyrophosphate-dependent dehydrogenase E1 component subunit alpha n=1 Tax=unclassified Roseateles TaxID=2626991 RepID=UPI0006FA8EC2|nr:MULTISPECIES: thiamine pyrophosphate-dependent dehydrogenase E1 component subunit alpha [unclassified Roseateles]KQW52203.1 dehydrogenase [Pelomonas sp. Root405]KRA78437.1 dehydrogenase [Pelomonas sp. Root662]